MSQASSRSMPSRRSRWRPGGFTLLELLIAISVLATVSIIAWRGLDSLVSTRARLEPEGDEIRALLTAFGQMDRDLAQTINPTLLAFTSPPVTVTVVGGQPALSVMRLAAITEADQPSALQLVGYRVEDGYLVRSASRPMRGRGAIAAEEITNVRLLGHVKSLQVRFWRDGQGWVDPLVSETPAAQPPAPGQPPALPGQARPFVPAGVEMTIERNDGKTFRKVLLVG